MVKRVIILFAAFLSLVAQSVSGQAAPSAAEIVWENITVSTSIDGPVGFPGEPVFVTVDVLSTLYFTRAVSVSPPDSPASLVFELGSAPVSRRIQTGTLNGVRFRFLVIPQVAGRITIPGMNIRTMGPPEGSATSRTVEIQSAELVLNVKTPSSSFTGASWLTASRLAISDSWHSVPDSLLVGDTVSRVVKINAVGTAASLIPLEIQSQLGGVAIYPGTPVTGNQISGGQINASRTDTVVYVFERAGEFLIPEESIVWWNSRLEKSETVVLESVAFTVLDDPTSRSNLFDPDSLILAADQEINAPLPFAQYSAWVLALLLVAFGGNRIIKRGIERQRRKKEAWVHSRDGKIAAFLKNSEHNDPQDFIADVYRLLDSLRESEGGTAQIRTDLTPFADRTTNAAILNVQRSLFRLKNDSVVTDNPGNLQQLTSKIGAALLASGKKNGEEAQLPPHPSTLPPLNR